MNITKLILRLKMGLDTVSLSTKKNMYTVYRDWRYSDTKLDFKSYLLEKDERIEAFANSFKQYNSGDMFTRETVVELEDGRLLCFDPDEFSKAYLIDLSDVTKDDIKFDMKNDFKMIKADKTKAGYETRNTAILSYLGSDIKTKELMKQILVKEKDKKLEIRVIFFEDEIKKYFNKINNGNVTAKDCKDYIIALLEEQTV